jgi:transposase-like protein
MMVRRGRERDTSKERFWRDVIRLHKRSGQTISEFCLEHDLSHSSFHAWRRTIAERDQQTKQAPPSITVKRHDLPAFVPLRVAPASETPTTSPLEVVVGPNRIIRVSPGFDAATLRHLLATLEEGSSC